MNYLLYVSFFPNIIAGPISKARNLLPQFRTLQRIDSELFSKALLLIIIGAFKKCVISDYIAANFVDRIFESPQYFTGLECFISAYGATLQIFMDFSGYTDMAMGLALLLGFKIEQNFNQPFLAVNITDFWRRWHISLSMWLNDYVYYPLSYKFRKLHIAGIVIAVMITFIISGIWHGPNITFIIWGLLQGIALSWDIITETYRNKLKKKTHSGIYRFISIFITLHFTIFSILFFKAPSLDVALQLYSKIFLDISFAQFPQWFSIYKFSFIIITMGFILHIINQKWTLYITNKFISSPWWAQSICVVVSLMVIYQFTLMESLPFVYLSF